MKQQMKPEWQMVKFGDVVKNANLVERDFDKAGIKRIVGLEHLDPENLHIRRWNFPENGTSFSRRFVPGQTLFGKRRAYQRKVAYAVFDGICSGDILTFESKDPNVLLPELLPFICQSDAFFDYALGTSSGSLSPRTSWNALKYFEFPLPPIEEQKRITEILWSADEAVVAWTKTIVDLQQLARVMAIKKFLLHEARKKTPQLPEGWRTGTLKDLVSIDPRMPPNLLDELDISFVAMEDICENGGITQMHIKKLGDVRNGYTYFAENDILFAKITPCMENNKGAIAKNLSNGIGIGSTEFFVLRVKHEYDIHFVYHMTMSKIYRSCAERWMQGSAGQRRVPKDFFCKRLIVIPPKNARIALGIIFASINNEIKKIMRHYELLNYARMKMLNDLLHINSEVTHV